MRPSGSVILFPFTFFLILIHSRSIPSALLALLALSLAPSAFASITDGTIHTTNRYAWSENAGWIDFGSTEGNVHVTDSALSGYAWSELTGWISLNCSNTSSCGTVDYNVTNNAEGTLGGYAWNENTGWIDFDPANGGVSIDSSGIFSGTAWGENIGWITFNCSTTSTCGTVNYTISTDWRPTSTRSSAAVSTTVTVQESRGGSGGGRRGSALQILTAQAQQFLLARYNNSLVALEAGSSSASSLPTVRRTSSASSFSDRLLAIAERRGRLLLSIGTESIFYWDVDTTAWYAPYVATLLTDGVAQGYKDTEGIPTGEFGVANPVTKAEVLKMALEAAGNAPDTLAKLAPQNRTARGTWAAAYVKRAEDLQFTVFQKNPDVHTPATRGEVMQTVLEALGYPIPKTPATFADVPPAHPHSPAIGLAAYYGFAIGDTAENGTPLNRFRPDDSMNRAEVSKIIALVREVARR